MMISFCVHWECVHSAFALWEVGMGSSGEFKQVNQCLNKLCKSKASAFVLPKMTVVVGYIVQTACRN